MISAASVDDRRDITVIGVGDKYRQTVTRLDKLTAWNYADLVSKPADNAPLRDR